jgi:hypothetical protein
MFLIKRKFTSKRGRLFALCGAFTLTFLLCSSGANATYVAAIFSGDVFVLGADSRNTSASGMPINDGFCKIVVLNDRTAFAGLGAIRYPLPARDVVDFPDLAKKSAAPTLQESATKFAEMVTSKLNSTPLGRKPPARLDPNSIGVFGGFDADGPPMLTITYILYTPQWDNFVFSGPEKRTTPDELIVVGNHKVTDEIMDSAKFNQIRGNATKPNAERLAETIEFLIREVIRRKVSTDVGGTPTVLILKKNQSPRWYSKAKDCLDLH